MQKRRVVVTGIGAVAPTGIGKKAFWEGVRNGNNYAEPITLFDSAQTPSKIACEIRNFDPKDFVHPDSIIRQDRSTHLGVAAAKLALEDGNLQLTPEIMREMGVIMGTGASGMGFAEKEMFKFFKGGLSKVHPYAGISTFCGALSSGISIELGLQGFSLTISTGCTGTHDAFGYALSAIRSGMTDILLSGGSDACVTPAILGAFCRIGAASTQYNDTPKKASRPFDKGRDGFVISEGAWVFILEELGHAEKRGAKIYGEVAGYGATCDAYHMTRPLPSGEETARAIEIALKDAEVEKAQVDYINAHGTSTPVNDGYETMVLKKVFGELAYKIPISSTKSMIGHGVGAAGAAGIAAALLTMENSFIHPTINQETPDPECDLDYVPNVGREKKVDVALCDGLAFGAKNSAVVLKKMR